MRRAGSVSKGGLGGVRNVRSGATVAVSCSPGPQAAWPWRRPSIISQYTTGAFQRLLRDRGVTCSMSRSGNVWDNAVMESFFSTLKAERTHGKHYATRNAARADVFDCIERFYKTLWRHSTLGDISPVVFERAAAVA